MALVHGINISNIAGLKAQAQKHDGSAWLKLQFGTTMIDSIAIHMPYDRAALIAEAINNAEHEYERQCEEAEAAIHGGQSYADEHRLGMRELL